MTSPHLVITGDFVQTGGMDVANHALALHLARSGEEVVLVGYRATAEITSYPNVQFRRVPKPANAYTLGAPLLAARGFLEAGRLARRHPRVLVNGGNCALPGTNWVHYVQAAYTPTMAGHGLRRTRQKFSHSVQLATERAALGVARVVIANSDVTRRHVVELLGIRADRVHTVYYGVDRARFQPPSPARRREALASLGWTDERPRVAFIGALGDRRKGFDIVFDAWRALCRERAWDAQLVVVGTGAELQSWRDRATSAKLGEHVSFLGFRRDVPTILAACDALVAPTRYEAYGLGVHEALCCGLPAFVSATSGVAERYPRALADLLLPSSLAVSDLVERLVAWRTSVSAWRDAVLPFSHELRGRAWEDMAHDVAALCGT